MKKKAFLIVLLLVLIPAALSNYQVFEAEGDEEIAAGDEITLQLQTTEAANYTADLIDSEDDVIFSDRDLLLTSNVTDNSTNTTEYTYSRNYTLSDDARVGEWKSSVFDGFSTENTTSVQVIPDELLIQDAEILPYFKNEDDDIDLDVEVTNPEENVESLTLSIENTSIQNESLEEISRSESIIDHRYDVGELSEGEYNYQLSLRGDQGTEDTEIGSFQVYSANRDADSSDINIGIAGQCGTAATQFRPPGGGILPTAREGSFLMTYLNNASSSSNVSADLNVTFQNETEWEPSDGEDEIGPQINKTYESMNETNLGAGESFSSSRVFPKTNQTGYYLARLDIDTTCQITDGSSEDPTVYDTQTFNFTDYVNFRVLIAGGETGGSGEPIEEPRPRDANQTGEESNETVEGDNDNPGETPEPEPDPVPEPVPDPIPAISLNIEAVNSSVSSPRGGVREIDLRMENLANESIENLSINPQTSNLPGDWNAESASINELEPNETVNKSVFMSPSENVEPGTYRASIFGSNSDRLLDVERIDFTVYENITESSIRISEAPEVVQIESGTNQTIPFLVENLGEEAVRNSTLTIQNLEGCGQASGSYSTSIDPKSSESIGLDLSAVSETQECNATVIVSTSDGAYSFADMRIEVVPDQGVVPPELRFPLFASAWTLLLLVYSFTMTRFELDSIQLKVPYLILIVGEAVIFLYIATEYYSLIPPELLPF